MLGPLLFSIYINCLDFNIDNARFHFYADYTIVYCSAPSKQQSVTALQSVFDIIQNRFRALKLVLNVEKTKCMLFSNSRTSLENSIVLQTSQGSQVTSVSEYKYLGIIIDNKLRFSSHIKYLSKKLKKKLGFYFRNKSCFPFKVRKKISVCYISTDSQLWGCGLPACPLLSSFFLGCFVPRCSEIYN